MESSYVTHDFQPVYGPDSRILILGTLPSVRSREVCFYYGHPRNRFWLVLAALRKESAPVTVEEKKQFLLRSHIAIWDVIASCDIQGSSDSSIRNVIVNDVGRILEEAPIKQIYANGDKAWQLYHRYLEEKTGREARRLPSTSPANAAYSLERLINEWSECLTWLDAPGTGEIEE